MWTLEKPDLHDAFEDIKAIIAASKGELIDDDEPHIRMVYQNYDDNKGFISKAVNNTLCKKQRKVLHELYSETGIKNKKLGRLYYIREELFDKVDQCPMCGMAPPQQLDHQLAQANYESVAVLRLNLVPVCGVCNNKKRAKSPYDFVHPYYAEFPENVVFLIAKVRVDVDNLLVSWSFDIDGTEFHDDELLRKVNNQVSVIELFKRLQKQSNCFLSEMLYGTKFLSDDQLKDFLQREYEKSKELFGLNHWRTALLSALYQEPRFSYRVVNNFISQIKPVNGSRNA